MEWVCKSLLLPPAFFLRSFVILSNALTICLNKGFYCFQKLENHCINSCSKLPLNMNMIGICYIPRTSGRNHRTGHQKRMKSKGNVKVINSAKKRVLGKNGAQILKCSWKIKIKNKETIQRRELVRRFPSQLQDLLSVVFWSRPGKTSL